MFDLKLISEQYVPFSLESSRKKIESKDSNNNNLLSNICLSITFKSLTTIRENTKQNHFKLFQH